MVRTIRNALVGLVLVLFFFALSSALWVRSSIEQGAFNYSSTCLNAPHYDRYKAGDIDQARIDGILASQVRDQHLAGKRVGIGRWHLLGGMALVGVRLGNSAAQRRAMFNQVMSHARLCPQDQERYRTLHPGAPLPPIYESKPSKS